MQQRDLDTTGAVIHEGRTFYDALDRLRFDQEQMLDGSYVYRAHRGYDSLGRTVLDYVPASTESPSLSFESLWLLALEYADLVQEAQQALDAGGGTQSDSSDDPENNKIPEVQVTAQRMKADQNLCGPSSWLPHGGGLMLGGSAEAGALLAGAGSQVATGGGVFYSSKTGVSAGHFATDGSVAYAGTHVSASPKQDAQPLLFGASFGGGAYGFLTNAQSVQQLGGHFQSYSVNLGIGPAQLSVNLALGGGIWQLSFSPPAFGETVGVSMSMITTDTDTDTSTGGCH